MSRAIIIGAGIHGRSVAAWLAPKLVPRGYELLLIDQYADHHRSGSSGGENRLDRPVSKAPGEPTTDSDIHKYAEQGYRMVEQQTGQQIYMNSHGFHAAEMLEEPKDAIHRPDALAFLAATKQACDRNSVLHNIRNGREQNERSKGFFKLRDNAVVVEMPKMRQIEAAKAMSAMLNVAKGAGAQICFNMPIARIDFKQNQVITSAGDSLHADIMIFATNGDQLTREAAYALPNPKYEQHNTGFFRFTNAVQGLPSPFAYETNSGIFYGMPSRGYTDKYQYMKVARHDHGIDLKQSRFCLPPDEESRIMLSAFVTEYLPQLSPRGAFYEACPYLQTDGMHRMGEIPDQPGKFFIHFDHGRGFKLAPAVGMGMLELVDGIPCGYDLDILDLGSRGDHLRQQAIQQAALGLH